MSWKSEHFAWLKERAENVTSQWGENGILAAIFERIDTANKYCCECGAGDGVFFSNTWPLLNKEGWRGLQIEADEMAFAKLGALYQSNPNVTCFNYKVQASGAFSFDRLLEKAGAPADLDLLVIDVDSNDYHLLNSLLKHRPRVVMVEFDPNADPDFVPPLGGEGQAGVQALAKLGIGKYYWPVIATKTNLIFVQQELCHLLVEIVGVPWDDFRKPAEKPPIGQLIQLNDDAPFPKVAAVMSTPRVGPLATMDSVYQACAPLGISMLRGEGAFWHHSLSRGIEKALEAGMDFILTVDYDTVFEFAPTDNAVAKLVCLLVDNPDVDVIVAAQMKREGGALLATTKKRVRLLDPLIPITQGHFGLTLFRRSVFERLPKPWLNDSPNEKGEWNENRVDADIYFWQQCEAHGINVQMSLDVLIGHMEWVVTWPGQHLQPHYQPLNDWRAKGKPLEAFDRRRVLAAVESNPALMYGAKLEMGG